MNDDLKATATEQVAELERTLLELVKATEGDQPSHEAASDAREWLRLVQLRLEDVR